jgi:hypothetical protein
MRLKIDRTTGRIRLDVPGLLVPSISPPAGPYPELVEGSAEGEQPALDEATAVAVAETVIDPTLLALRDLLDEQTRAADAIAQAAAAVSQAQQAASFRQAQRAFLEPASFRQAQRAFPEPASFRQAQRAFPEPVEGITVPASVARKIRELLARDPLFLDYETTHLHLKHGARVCEIGILNGQGRAVFSTLVNPQQSIPPAATAVHRLTDAAVAAAPTWVEVAPTLRRTLANRLVVAYSAGFERKFTPKWGIEWICAKKLADGALGPWAGRGGLQARLEQCGLSGGPAHTAGGDNLSTIRLLRFLAGLEQIN